MPSIAIANKTASEKILSEENYWRFFSHLQQIFFPFQCSPQQHKLPEAALSVEDLGTLPGSEVTHRHWVRGSLRSHRDGTGPAAAHGAFLGNATSRGSHCPAEAQTTELQAQPQHGAGWPGSPGTAGLPDTARALRLPQLPRSAAPDRREPLGIALLWSCCPMRS